jgi:hypothetical protein
MKYTYSQTQKPIDATVFQTVADARDHGLQGASKWQMHFMICNAEVPVKGFIVRLANGQYLKAEKQ